MPVAGGPGRVGLHLAQAVAQQKGEMLRLSPGKGQGAHHFAAEIMEPVGLFFAGEFLPVGVFQCLVVEHRVQVHQQRGVQCLFGVHGHLLLSGRYRQQIMGG